MLALDHVALVLPDIDAAARRFVDLGIAVGPAEEFEPENTREIYVEATPVKLLLVQARSSSGPIGRHVARRGHGFHHIGFVTTDVRSILRGLRAWLICPSTLRNLERRGPAWIARPDANLLVELPGERQRAAVRITGLGFRPNQMPRLGAWRTKMTSSLREKNWIVSSTEVGAVREREGVPSFREVTIALADLDLGRRLLGALGLEASPQFTLRQGARNGIESVALALTTKGLSVGPTGKIA
ncbi:VOC family protein [bacterium]|nr:VOC family protein [bacterium]